MHLVTGKAVSPVRRHVVLELEGAPSRVVLDLSGARLVMTEDGVERPVPGSREAASREALPASARQLMAARAGGLRRFVRQPAEAARLAVSTRTPMPIVLETATLRR